jgi:hypothetical protein
MNYGGDKHSDKEKKKQTLDKTILNQYAEKKRVMSVY